MSAATAAVLLVLGMVSAYRAATARHELTRALGMVISGLAACNAYVLAVRGWPWN